ncbi:SapC family protein [Ancylobacter sp. FA202]|uniref:SapC family protein n=1 Tax=Ancylobacter sp. FA202 TaxID=1111106 RepID=UPI00037A7B34|nr:SapC family protein [Ancylobacter sp. FA202]
MTADASILPLFYRAPALLRFPDHRLVGVREGADVSYAEGATAIPLVAGEFLQAQRSYPIVFSNDADAAPLAVTGTAAGTNLFASEGAWAEGHYVPSYVRRYPFISMAPTEGGVTLLGIDLAAAKVTTDAVRDGARALFLEDGSPTTFASASMAFCDAYALEHERTRAFSAALVAENLLATREARIVLSGGAEKRVQGFRLVDEAAFRSLSSDTLATFHRNGWLDLIILHLASQLAWQGLVERSATPAEAPAQAVA